MYFKEKIIQDINDHRFSWRRKKNEHIKNDLEWLIDLSFFEKFTVVKELSPRMICPFPPEGFIGPLSTVNEYYYNITECASFDKYKERMIVFYREVFDQADYINKKDFDYLMERVVYYFENGDWEKEKGIKQLIKELKQENNILRKGLKIIGYLDQLTEDNL